MKKHTHGGPGRGQGRHTIADQPMLRKNVALDPDTIARAKEIGDGNLSAGLRIAVAHFAVRKA